MMDKADPAQKLYNKMRLWEFPDQFVVEPTDGSSSSSLAISRLDGSMKLIGNSLTFSLFFVIWIILFIVGCCGSRSWEMGGYCLRS